MTTSTKKAPPKRKPTSRGGAAGLMSAATAQPAAAAVALPLDQIDPTHFTNPRGDIDSTTPEFIELMQSIRELDILQPVLVGPALVKGGKHPLLAGWRRYAAAGAVGLTSIPVRQVTEIREAKDALAAAIAENVARQDMTPLAEARAIDTLMREHGLTQVAAGKRIGMSERTVRERLRLLAVQEASPTVAQAMSDQVVPARAATWFAEFARIAPEAAERVLTYVSTDAPAGSEQYTASDLASIAYADELVEDALRADGVDGAKLAVNIGGWIFVSRLPFPERRLKPLLARLDGSNTVDLSHDVVTRLVSEGVAVRSPAGGAWAYPGEWLFHEVEAAIAAQEQARAELRASVPTAPQAPTAPTAAADQPSSTDVEASRSEREQEARARELAHHANVILGERLSLEACTKLAEHVDAAKALAHFLVTDELKRLLERGQRYTDPAHVTETVAKNGTVKRKYELDEAAAAELRDHIDAATTPAEAFAPVLRAMLLALHADEAVTAQSNRAYYSWPYGRWGDTGGGRSAKTGLDRLRDVIDLPGLDDQARERAATAASTVAVRAAKAPELGKWAKRALELITAQPGITIPELAEAMTLKQNMLYRVVPGLQKDGLIRKDGRGWHPVEATS